MRVWRKGKGGIGLRRLMVCFNLVLALGEGLGGVGWSVWFLLTILG